MIKRIHKCCIASGALNFFFDGYWYDDFYIIMIPGFQEAIERATPVAKTTTLLRRAGNMPLTKHLQPKEFKPACIKVYPWKGSALNAVSLSGPGARALFEKGIWQERKKPFLISFMATADSVEDRLCEAEQFVEMFEEYLPNFHAPVGLQINVSCPNTKHDTQDLSAEALHMLSITSKLNIPLDLKVNIFMPTKTIKEIQRSGLCDTLTLSNTIPFGSENAGIDWKKEFPNGSPLKKFGGGGLSGQLILPSVLGRIKELRKEGIKMFIKGSGGIMSVADVDAMKEAGANAIEIGTVLMLRPWRVPAIVKRAEHIF